MEQGTFFAKYSGAKFSPDRKRRFYLYRVWDRKKPIIAFVGLNPSTANEDRNDPTIRKLISFTSRNGFGGFYMFNLFTIVSPDPSVLTNESDQDCEYNRLMILGLRNDYSELVFCWGSFETFGRDKEMIKAFPNAKCFRKNKNGSPAHPLYLPKDISLIEYNDNKTGSKTTKPE